MPVQGRGLYRRAGPRGKSKGACNGGEPRRGQLLGEEDAAVVAAAAEAAVVTRRTALALGEKVASLPDNEYNPETVVEVIKSRHARYRGRAMTVLTSGGKAAWRPDNEYNPETIVKVIKPRDAGCRAREMTVYVLFTYIILNTTLGQERFGDGIGAV